MTRSPPGAVAGPIPGCRAFRPFAPTIAVRLIDTRADSDGTVFGTTCGDAGSQYGTVFEVTPGGRGVGSPVRPEVPLHD